MGAQVAPHTWSSGRKVSAPISHVRLCDPMDSSPPGSSVRGTLQATILGNLICKMHCVLSFSNSCSLHPEEGVGGGGDGGGLPRGNGPQLRASPALSF